MIMSRLLRLFPSCVLLAIPVSASAVDFQEGWHLKEGRNSQDVTLVDIDQDGDLDAYVTEGSGPDRLWINITNNIDVRCKPTGVDLFSASLDVVTNDPDEGNVSWSLSCEGQTPDLETVFKDGFEEPIL